MTEWTDRSDEYHTFSVVCDDCGCEYNSVAEFLDDHSPAPGEQ